MRLSLFCLLLFSVFNCETQTSQNCPFQLQNHKPEDKCGYVEVPRSRSNYSGTKTKIAYLVIRSESENRKEDPIVFLQGGPGGDVLRLVQAYTELNPDKDRDFILYDQRGIGFSEELCPELKTSLLRILSMDLTVHEELETLQNELSSCKEFLKNDRREFSTRTNAEDLEALRKHLGYKRLNLFGGSYGTRLGLTYMDLYPKRVRSAILSGLFPPEVRMYKDIFSNFNKALNLVFSSCDNDVDCKNDYPKLKEDYFLVFESLKHNPIRVPITAGEVVINSQDMLLITHQMLYSQDTIEQIPEFISALKSKELDTIEGIIAQILPRLNLINIANYYSIMSADEGVYDNKRFILDDSQDSNNLGGDMSLFSGDPHIIENWTSQIPNDNDMHPIASDIPTLLISGQFDPITPPSNADLVNSRLTNGQHLVFNNSGHVPLDDCFFKIAKHFLDQPNSQVPSECLNSIETLDWD